MRSLFVSLALAACTAAPPSKPTRAEPRPPAARKITKDVSVNGDRRIDDSFWLRDKGTPEVESYLRAETAYADAMMQPTAALRQNLYAEMLARIQEADTQVPPGDVLGAGQVGGQTARRQ